MDRFIPKGDPINERRAAKPRCSRHTPFVGQGQGIGKGDPPPEDPKKTFALEVRPDEVKALYARVLALQSLVDERLDPREIQYLYVFMSRIGLSSDSRDEVRQALATKRRLASGRGPSRRGGDLGGPRQPGRRSPSPSSRTCSTSPGPTTWCSPRSGPA